MNEHTPETDPKDNGQQANKPTGLSTGKLMALAVVLGGIAGIGGLYAMGAFQGNGVAQVANANACNASFEAAADLDPFLTGDIAAMALRTQGAPLGDLSFNTVEGNAVTLADTGDGYRLVNIWATWCAPCREEMPWLDALQAQEGGDRFKVVAISVDGGSDEKPKAFYEEFGIEHLTYYQDPTINVFNRLKREGLAFGLPVTLLVDDQNCVIANMNGPAHWSSPDAVNLARELIKR